MLTVDQNTRRAEQISVRCREIRAELDRTLAAYRIRQQALAGRFRVAKVVPQPYTEVTRAAIRERANRCIGSWDFAWTSGTTSEPKQVFYPASRLQRLADHFVDQVLLATESQGITNPQFFFLNSFANDRSLSALLSRSIPSRLLTAELLESYFVLRSAAVHLFPHYSSLGLQWALLWSLRPTVVTTVNPSSLCVLLRNGREAWPALREQVLQILDEPDWQEALDRCGLSPTRFDVLDWLAATTEAPTPDEMLPQVELIYCWQGGYVRPFVDQLRDQLLPRQPCLFPMFSLSTEVVAHSVFPQLSQTAGLPIYPGCCYEFLPRDAESTSGNILLPWELVAGQEYRMVVSDDYGLVRYDTQDLFRCVGHVDDTPLIDFVRRYGLNYSFTGEKVTDHHLQQACAEVARVNGLTGAAFTCFPQRGVGPVPGYLFVLLAPDCTMDRESVARQLDDALCRINSEYAAKRMTKRLATPQVITMSAEMLIAKLARALPRTAGANPGQFKLLPLYTVLWEDVESVSSLWQKGSDPLRAVDLQGKSTALQRVRPLLPQAASEDST
ncbi:MAG: GH3 auxin-responsive promoter family protein [Planctomycetes bacterium]|nr:GH3 auxin-responsive promoter family protein [Planctomycetota bacterium]